MKELIDINQQVFEIVSLFYDIELISYDTINTSRNDSDFREVILVKDKDEKSYIIKLADNDFTFPQKIKMWKKTAEEYNKLGYFCPRIFCDKAGRFPIVSYKGRNCVVYAEEYAPYRSAESFNLSENEREAYEKQKWIMTAKVASKYFTYTDYPSGFCLFEKFCSNDEMCEVFENAMEWHRYAKLLPSEFQAQVDKIWDLWKQNKEMLEPLYKQLPISVFQADLNPTNILLNENREFVGIYDMNLCGKDVLLNYLMRENYNADFAKELDMIFGVLKTVSSFYHFSDIEKQIVLMLYRCIKPLWFTRIEKLKFLKNDLGGIQAFLDETERYLTERIDFSMYM